MKNKEPLNILFLGHSLIEFFDWEARFPEHNVANLGVAGETVEGLLGRLDRVITRHPSADLIFIMTGTNDIAMEYLDFTIPYGVLIDRLKAAWPDARIHSHSVLPIMIEWIDPGVIVEANRAIRRLASEKGVEYIDLYSRFVDEERMPVREYFLDDGVHLSQRGYEVWAEVLEPLITGDGD
jgi:lysophospholipase L1-like esterase